MLEESYGEMISEFFSPNLLIFNSNDFYCVDTVLWGTLFCFILLKVLPYELHFESWDGVLS